MILQSLADYYGRLGDDPELNVPPPGYSNEKIHFVLVLSPDGTLMATNDIREPAARGNKLLPKILAVPSMGRRTSGVAANALWDNTGYVLGADAKGKPERAIKQFEAFKVLQRDILGKVDDPGVKALLAFLDGWRPEAAADLPGWDDLAGSNVVFRLDGEEGYIHERPAARQAWGSFRDGAERGAEGFCLVSGQRAPIARLHGAIKGVRGAQTSGAALVSFNLDAFTSHGKEQNHNAPVSEEAAFAYVTALNHLLAPNSGRVVQVGDASTVFWSERPNKVEAFFAAIMGGKVEEGAGEAHDAGLVKDLRDLLLAVGQGRKADADVDSETPFYVLGLSPNAARLSVRFWLVSTVAEIKRRLAEHLNDLAIDRRYPKDPEFPGVWRLLIETAPQRKSENIPPNLAGEIMRAVITGGRYPRSLVSIAIGRARAEKEVGTFQAALLKAYYARALRRGQSLSNISSEEVHVSLSEDSTNIGYRLGRLFAVMEKAQRDALGQNINATIRDRYFGAASATPRSVFPRLLSLAQHHVSKAEYGYVSDRAMAEILEGLPAEPFPAHLTMDDQAMFFLGYYHQRNAFYRKKQDATPAAAPQE